MRAIVINCSHPHYNLGAAKLADWLRGEGYDVTEQGLGDADLVCLSVIFSWHAPYAVKIAQQYIGKAEIWAGGPGLYKMTDWWNARVNQLQCKLQSGLDWRFERQRGKYRVTFASRGCPVNCWYCPVTAMEGKEFKLDYDFQPTPILCDNNLSALSVEFQQYIVDRYTAHGVRLLDANSGFEAKEFNEDTYRRWKPVMKGAWRTAFDILPRHRYVKDALHILRDEPSRRKRIYVLAGNEPIASCYERAQKVLEWGGEPHVQPVMSLTAETKTPTVAHDWTEESVKDFARYYNTWGFRSYGLRDYKPRIGEPPPFRDAAL